MPGTAYYRAIATARYFQRELENERDAHNAMKLCFEKIHESLDMYKGHYINRLRFHLNRHHTEYLRKVRAAKKEKGDTVSSQGEDGEESATSPQRRSMRVGIAQDLANEVEQMKNIIKRKDLDIERLAMLLDEVEPKTSGNALVIVKQETITTTQPPIAPAINMKKLMNPFYPSDDEDFGDSVTMISSDGSHREATH